MKGDLCKVAFVPGLSAAAQHLMRNAFQAIKALAGTNGVRRRMRFISKSMQVYYGVPVFVTISPDERHQAIMLRMFRLRQSDPAYQYEPFLQQFSGCNDPSFFADETATSEIPAYAARRVALAQRPAAAVIGFRVQILLVMQAAFGLRVCLDCPNCARTRDCNCMDLLGSSSRLEGGAMGRCCAVCWSIENQKQGPLHVHGHLVLENLHQHHNLQEIATKIAEKGKEVTDQYFRFKAHACREEYMVPERWNAAEREKVEKAWPEYADENDLYLLPSFFGWSSEGDEAGERWLKAYRDLVFTVQSRRQHHIHLPNAQGTRQPLPSCLDSTKSGLCKHGFPFLNQLLPECCVICPGMGEKLQLPLSGRKNALGMLHGPLTDENLNGTAGVLLALGRDNSDVQIPYRLPICRTTHSELCSQNCVKMAEENHGWASAMEHAAATAQAAQVGYQTDYANKGQGAALHECREFCKGHQRLSEEKLQNEGLSYICKRHTLRLIADCSLRGRVRSAEETENLNMHAEDQDCCAAEMWTSFPYMTFPGNEFLVATERAETGDVAAVSYRLRAARARGRAPDATIAFQNQAIFYGFRGRSSWIRYLSPFEWISQWEVVLKPVPPSLCHCRCYDFELGNGIPDGLE